MARLRSICRLGAALLMTATLLACASQSGPTMASLASVGQPPSGQARIIVMRPEKGMFGLGDRGLPIKLDGEPMGEILTGRYASADRPAGRHQLSAEWWDWPGVTRYDFTAAPGRTYYFATKVKEKVGKVSGATAVAGLAGFVVASAMTDDGGGPIDFVAMTEAEAKQAIANASAPQ
ncbi:MAG TPA: DUF2846 domain-containing protein [Xanthobacteraceae bacterium]|jgi:hypothetical protein